MKSWNHCHFTLLLAGMAIVRLAGAEHRLHPSMEQKPLPFAAKGASPLVAAQPDGLRVAASGQPVRVHLVPAEGVWDCSSKLWMLLDVANLGDAPVLVRGQIKSAGTSSWAVTDGAVEVPAGATRPLPILVSRKLSADDQQRMVAALGDLRGFPGGHQNSSWRQVDAAKINGLQLDFFTDAPKVDCLLSKLRGAIDFALPAAGQLETLHRPCMDRFGQNAAEEWPLKIGRAAQLPERLRQEEAWLAKQAPLQGRSRFGGWTVGPKTEATGHFRTLKRDGKWWLADPEGNLFWSLGITCVGHDQGGSRTAGLRKALENTPADETLPPLLRGLKGESWNPYQANLQRKHGADWAAANAEFAHRRLHAWGINTMGNWSSPEFYHLGKTPYVVAVHYDRPLIDGRDGKWGNDLPDVFHPEFRERTFARLREEARSSADPWCIGYFIDNELSFPDAATPGGKALAAPPESPARQRLAAWLQEKHQTVEALNAAWGSGFADWSGLRPVDGQKTEAYWRDLQGFGELYLRTYYGTCRDAVRAATPGKLYLGSRINHVKNKTALSVCAEYADVVSVNFYNYTPDALALPQGFDAPVLVGEFHFGTVTERGAWGAGLATGTDIGHAAELYRAFARAALKHPQFVGAHWFQFADQPLSGRFDGENHRIGFVDITDTPYPEMAGAARAVAENMYELRLGERAIPK